MRSKSQYKLKGQIWVVWVLCTCVIAFKKISGEILKPCLWSKTSLLFYKLSTAPCKKMQWKSYVWFRLICQNSLESTNLPKIQSYGSVGLYSFPIFKNRTESEFGQKCPHSFICVKSVTTPLHTWTIADQKHPFSYSFYPPVLKTRFLCILDTVP